MRDLYGSKLTVRGVELRWYCRDGLFDVWIGKDGEMFAKCYTIGDSRVPVLWIGHAAVNLGDDLNNERARVMNEHLRKAYSRATSQGAVVEVDDPDFAGRFPCLAAFLLCNADDGGNVRERAKVHVFAEGGKWKCSLSDGETRASLFMTLARPQDAFQALEKALGAVAPDWRPWRDAVVKGKK